MFDRAHLEQQTCKQLRHEAKAAGMRGYSRLRKAELVALLLAAPEQEKKPAAKKRGRAKRARAKQSAAASGTRSGGAQSAPRLATEKSNSVVGRSAATAAARSGSATQPDGAATPTKVRLKVDPRVGAKFTTGDPARRGSARTVAGAEQEMATAAADGGDETGAGSGPPRGTAGIGVPEGGAAASLEALPAAAESSGDAAGAVAKDTPGAQKRAPSDGVESSAPEPKAAEPEPEEEVYELPPVYGSRRVFLAARDPRWLHVYWDFTDEQLEAGRQAAADGIHRLRLVAEGREPRVAAEVELPPGARNWYFQHKEPGGRFSVHLGYLTTAGRFLEMGASRTVTTPAESTQPGEETFVAVPVDVPFRVLNAPLEEADDKMTAGTGAEQAGSEEPGEDTAATARSAAERDEPSAKQAATGANDGANDGDEDRGKAAQGHTGGNRGGAWEGGHLVARTRVAEPPPATPEGERMALPREAGVGEGASASATGWSGESSPRGAFDSRPLDLPGSPSSWARGAGEPPVVVNEEPAVAAASHTDQDAPFQLRVNAVVAIYGEAEPGARLQVNDHRIKSDSAGRFSLHYALPDGEFAVHISATAAKGRQEGATRSVEIGFTRRTLPHGEVGIYPLPASLEAPPKAAADIGTEQP
jgi:hypothetical protein